MVCYIYIIKNMVMIIKSKNDDIIIRSDFGMDINSMNGDMNINSMNGDMKIITSNNLQICGDGIDNIVNDDTLSYKVISNIVEIGKDDTSSTTVNGNTLISKDLIVDGEIIGYEKNITNLELVSPEIVSSGITTTIHELHSSINDLGEIEDITRKHVAHFNSQFSTLPEAVTFKAAQDLQILYDHLLSLPVDDVISTPVKNITLTGGVYKVNSACVIAENVILSGNSTDIFVLIVGGALSTNASTSIVLTGGILSTNIFWVTNPGAIAYAHTNITFPGRSIAQAAMSVGSGGIIDGGIYSIAGAVSFNNVDIRLPTEISQLISYIGSLSPFVVFTKSGAIANTATTTYLIGDLGTNLGAITGFPPHTTNDMYISTDMLSQYYIYFKSNGVKYCKRFINSLTGCVKGGIISLHAIIPENNTHICVVVENLRGEITFYERTFSLIAL